MKREPARSVPSVTRTYDTTPRYGSNCASNTSPRTKSSLPLGGGTRVTIASRISAMPMPSFALQRIASLPSMTSNSSISFIDALGIGGRQIDLIDDGDDREVLFEREVVVRERLRFDALRRVDHEQRTLARAQRARYLRREVDVTRRVDEVELVARAVSCEVVERDGVHLDRDAALAFEVHRVEQLRFHLPLPDRARDFQEAGPKASSCP